MSYIDKVIFFQTIDLTDRCNIFIRTINFSAAAKSGEKTTEEKTKQEASDWKEGAAEELEEGSQGDIYVVRKGDTLLSISRKVYGTDENIASICKINGLKENDFIYVGQKLLLP